MDDDTMSTTHELSSTSNDASSTLSSLLFLIGLATIVGYSFLLARFLCRHVMGLLHFTPGKDRALSARTGFAAKYGPGSWAVVTGGSDGIGREYAMELARRGMRVLVIARSVAKLQKVVGEIEQASIVESHSSSQPVAAYISFDFSVASEAAGAAYESLFRQIEAIVERGGGGNNNSSRVSLLVNNVGINYDHCEYFADIPSDQNVRMMRINCESQLRMTHYFYNKFQQQQQQQQQGSPPSPSTFSSGIVDMSSLSGVVPIPLSSVYAATKAFNGHFSKSLAVEASGLSPSKIDIISVYPGYVATEMTHTDKPTISIASASSVVTEALNQLALGQVHTTPGALAHAPLYGLLEKCAPSAGVEWFMLRQNKMCREKGWIAPDVADRSHVVASSSSSTTAANAQQEALLLMAASNQA